MIEYILNYLELKGQIIASAAEEAAVETGISLYLKENGIGMEGCLRSGLLNYIR